jgi:hypothetical protein
MKPQPAGRLACCARAIALGGAAQEIQILARIQR